MQDHDPYRAPTAAVTSISEPLAGARMYKVSGVGLATFLGSPLAGGWLIARNYHALGQPEKAARAIGYSVVGTIAVLILAFFLPERVPGFLVSLPPLVAVTQIARHYQGDRIAEYTSAGRTYSNWRAFGVGLLALAALVAIIVVLAIVAGMSGLVV